VTLPMLRAMVPDSVQRVSGSIGTPMSARPAFLRAGRPAPGLKLATSMSQSGHSWRGWTCHANTAAAFASTGMSNDGYILYDWRGSSHHVWTEAAGKPLLTGRA